MEICIELFMEANLSKDIWPELFVARNTSPLVLKSLSLLNNLLTDAQSLSLSSLFWAAVAGLVAEPGGAVSSSPRWLLSSKVISSMQVQDKEQLSLLPWSLDEIQGKKEHFPLVQCSGYVRTSFQLHLII